MRQIMVGVRPVMHRHDRGGHDQPCHEQLHLQGRCQSAVIAIGLVGAVGLYKS